MHVIVCVIIELVSFCACGSFLALCLTVMCVIEDAPKY